MGLFKKDGLYDYIKKHTVNPTKKGVKNTVKTLRESDTDFEHLTAEGELPFGWHTRHKYIVEPYENAMVQMATNLKGVKGYDRIRQIEGLIVHYYNFKNFCYSKNECFVKYFQNSWEHCHNSRCKDFEYIEPYEKELEELKGQE